MPVYTVSFFRRIVGEADLNLWIALDQFVYFEGTYINQPTLMNASMYWF